MTEWHDFFVAEAGASAALAGLIAVGLSISLAELLKYPHLLLRAAGALVLLMAVLVTSTMLLAPGQTMHTIGIEVLGAGLVFWLITTGVGAAAMRGVDAQYRGGSLVAFVLRQCAIVLFVVAGVVVLSRGEGGLYWLVPAFIAAFVVALVDAWVILVEVHR
jgi:modulator of FtsH protease